MPRSPAPVFETADEISTTASTIVILQPARAELGPRAAALDAEIGGLLASLCAEPAFLAQAGNCSDIVTPRTMTPRRVIVLALGKGETLDALSLARAGGALAAHLEARGLDEATLVLDPIAACVLSPGEILAQVALGLRLRRYRFDLRNKRPLAQEDRPWRITLVGGGKAELARVNAIADGVEYARTLINLPPNHIHPDNFAEHLEPLRQAGVEVEILDASQLKELGMNALLAVGSGSVRPPRVAVLRYRGKGGDEPPLAFVGKGVCFDSGGLCIKTGPQMFDMKADMAGAAVVAGLLLSLARQGSPINAVGVLGLAENMPSGSALKPRDIIVTASGQSVEIFDTDAEGRLLLADCLYYTASRFKPAVMVDLATLTYSVMRGLGSVFAGLFSTDDILAAGMIAAGEGVGERFWRLPLDHAYDEGLHSPFADLRHHAKDLEEGDAPYAAAFLRHFTEGRPWVHLDIAGKEMAEADGPLGREGGTAFGVRMLEEWVHAKAGEV
ncbi:leucyl aminopeptidase [Labrys neptuniae]